MARKSTADKTRRLLNMVHLLSTQNTTISINELAKLYDITPREALEDIEKLACCGLSDGRNISLFTIGSDVVVWDNAPALTKALKLSKRETLALIAALEYAGFHHDDPLRLKLLSSLGSQDSQTQQLSYNITAQQSFSSNIVHQLSYARSLGVQCCITYMGINDSAPLKRTIEPLHLHFESGNWYIEAYCHRAHAPRSFRLDRISSIELLSEPIVHSTHEVDAHSALAQAPSALILITQPHKLNKSDWTGLYKLKRTPEQHRARLAQAIKQAQATQENVPEDMLPYIAKIPYSGSQWLARRIIASQGAVVALEPARLIEDIIDIAHDLRATKQ